MKNEILPNSEDTTEESRTIAAEETTSARTPVSSAVEEIKGSIGSGATLNLSAPAEETTNTITPISSAVEEIEGSTGSDASVNPSAPAEASDPQMLEFSTWEEIRSLPLEEPVEFVEGLITEGFTIMAAKPKQGKSTIMCAIALAIASGLKAFGELKVTRSKVVMLALETSPRRFQKDISKLPEDQRRAFSRIGILFNWNPDIALYAGLASFLNKHREVKVLIIDTLGRFLGISGGTKAGYEKRYETGAILKNIADEFNVAIIGLHHLKKGTTGDNPVDAIMGSTGLPAAADNIITLQRSRTTGITTLEVTGRNIDEAQFQLKYCEDTRTFGLITNHSQITLGREAKSALDFLIATGGTKTFAEIQQYLGKEKTAVSNLLKVLYDRGLIIKPGHGTYQSAPMKPALETE